MPSAMGLGWVIAVLFRTPPRAPCTWPTQAHAGRYPLEGVASADTRPMASNTNGHSRQYTYVNGPRFMRLGTCAPFERQPGIRRKSKRKATPSHCRASPLSWGAPRHGATAKPAPDRRPWAWMARTRSSQTTKAPSPLNSKTCFGGCHWALYPTNITLTHARSFAQSLRQRQRVERLQRNRVVTSPNPARGFFCRLVHCSFPQTQTCPLVVT